MHYYALYLEWCYGNTWARVMATLNLFGFCRKPNKALLSAKPVSLLRTVLLKG